MYLSPTESDAGLRAKPRPKTKNSCQCCSPPRESVLGVRSLKPKPSQTLLETSTDFAAVTGPRTVSPSSCQRSCALEITPEPPGTTANTRLHHHPSGSPRRAQSRVAVCSPTGKLLRGRAAVALPGAGRHAARHCHLVAGGCVADDSSQHPAQDSSLGPGSSVLG